MLSEEWLELGGNRFEQKQSKEMKEDVRFAV